MMEHTYFTRHLKSGEEPIEVIRPHIIGHLASLTLGAVLLLLPFFFMFYLLSRGMRGTAVFFILLLIGLVTLVRAILIWMRNGVVITPDRIVDFDQPSLFHKAVSDVSFEQIIDVSYKQKGLFATLYGYGTVMVKVSGNLPDLEIQYARDPKRIQEMIVGLSKNVEKEDPREDSDDDRIDPDEYGGVEPREDIKDEIRQPSFQRKKIKE